MLYPMLLEPALKRYLWGGQKLYEKYHKSSKPQQIAESWELSVHPQGISRIVNGEYAGNLLSEYIAAQKSAVIGDRADRLPLLIKLIDAEKPLSVQVHPDEAYAAENEGGECGKTELWYVMDCKPNAEIYFGTTESLTRQEFLTKAQDGTIVDSLQKKKVKKGDVYLIPPGTIHALGAGMTVAEIASNSNITYRIYDYNRLGDDGNLRELHLEKAADVTAFSQPKEYRLDDRIDCGSFIVERITVSEGQRIPVKADARSFHDLLAVEGNLLIHYGKETLQQKCGDNVFIPAGYGQYEISGSGVLLKTTI